MDFDPSNVIQAFLKWIQMPPPFSKGSLEIIQNADIYKCWYYLSKLEDFKELSEIALRILCIPSSEASCEKIFWKQRKTLTDQRVRTSPALSFARIVMMTTDIV